jgi:hypothetical protein
VNLSKDCQYVEFVHFISVNVGLQNTAPASVLQHVAVPFIALVYDMCLHYVQ